MWIMCSDLKRHMQSFNLILFCLLDFLLLFCLLFDVDFVFIIVIRFS